MASINIDADYDAQTNSDGSNLVEGGTTSVNVFADSTPTSASRVAMRFPLSSISTATAINDVALFVNITSETVEAGEDVDVYAYNSTGDDDPDADTGATMWTRAASGSVLVQVVGNQLGNQTVDLGATADGHVLGNLSSPGWYSLGFANDASGWTNQENVRFRSIENVTDPPSQLIIDYTPAAGGTAVKDIIGSGFIPFAR